MSLTRMKQRRGTQIQWDLVGTTLILADGEIGLVTNTGKFKIGDGEKVWNALSYHLTDIENGQLYAKSSQSETITGKWTFEDDISLASKKITGVVDPTDAADVANKHYVDSLLSGLIWKESINLLANANIALTGPTNIDGEGPVIDGHDPLTLGDTGYRLLLTGQTIDSENGVYVYSDAGLGDYVLERSADADTYQELTDFAVLIKEGTTYAGTSWTQSHHYLSSFSGQTWVQFSGTVNFTAGTGMTATGTVYDVNGTTGRITANVDSLDIASDYVGQSSISTLGTVTTGIWNASTIGLARGGTGATTASEARTALGVPALSENNTFSGTNSFSASGTQISLFGTGTFVAPDSFFIPLSVKGATSQTGKLQVWQNSSNTVVASVGPEGNLDVSGEISSTYASGSDGGQLNLAKPISGTTLAGKVVLDINGDKLRIFENGGDFRGYYLDISAADASVGTALPSAGGSTSYGPFLPMQSGKYYRGDRTLSTVSASGTNNMMGVPFFVAKETTLDAIGITTAVVTTAGIARLGIYSDPGNTGAGTTLVIDAGEVSYSASSTVYEISISQVLSPGWHFLSVVIQSGSSTWLGYASYLPGAASGQVLTNTSNTGVGNLYYGNTFSGALPSTVSGAYFTGYTTPSPYVKVA